MDEESKQEILRILNEELHKQKQIFQKHTPIAINPANTPEYDIAKRAFDHANQRVRELEDRIAWLLTEETYEPTILDKILNIVDKIIKDDDEWKDQSSVVTGTRG